MRTGNDGILLAVRALCLAGLVAIATILLYSLQNRSGHCGISPWLSLIVFVPLLLAGIVGLLRSGGYRSLRTSARLGIAVSLLGVLLLVYLDISNTLLQYEVWIERGMP
jgi:hypothetical protein